MYKKNESLPSLQIHPYAPQFHYGCCLVINVLKDKRTVYWVKLYNLSQANDSQNIDCQMFRRINAIRFS